MLRMKFFLHRFPANPHLVRERMGGIGYFVLERLNKMLPQAVLSNQDTRDVIRAIDAILEHVPHKIPQIQLFDIYNDLIGHNSTRNYPETRTAQIVQIGQ